MSKTQPLSDAAKTAMQLLCRLHAKEPLTEQDLEPITREAVMELYDRRLVNLPVKIEDMRFPDAKTIKLTLRSLEQVTLTEDGLQHCQSNRA